MKIALAFPGCHRRGGVERIMLESALFLARRDHEVHLFVNDLDSSAFVGEDGESLVHCHPVAVKPGLSFRYGYNFFEECTQTLDQKTFDVFGSFGCVSPTGGVLWTQSVQKAWLERCKQFRPPLSLARMRQRLNPLHPLLLDLEARHFAERNYRKVIAATEAVREDLYTFYDVPRDDVIVMPNGFVPTEFNPERRQERRAEMRRKLGIRDEHIALLFVANELERKGYGTILGAMRQLADPNLRLIVVGKPDVALVQKLAAKFGVENQVIAAGLTKDVSSFHAASDLFVLPTQYEAFCLAILEALGSGLPVITTRIPGAQDAIQEGVNGLLIDDPNSSEQLAEALRRLSDESVRRRMTQQAPESVSEYQWPTVLLRYEQILQENRS